MLAALLSILVMAVILAVVLYVLRLILPLPAPPPAGSAWSPNLWTVIQALALLAFVVWALMVLFGAAPPLPFTR